MKDTEAFTAKGVFCELASSHAGQAVLRVILYREMRSGRRVRYEIRLELERGSDSCILTAMKKFAQQEKETAAAMAHRWGV